MAAVVLIEFTSSDSWRNRLSRSSFNSCEDDLSTEEGRRTALGCMLSQATHTWSAFLRTPAKIIAAIKRLEELRCLNTAGVVILWDWTTGVVNTTDHDSWGSIERVTLEFCQTHGIEHLDALKRHVVGTDKAAEADHLEFLLRGVDCEGSPCRLRSVRRPVTITTQVEKKYLIDCRISRVCQLRRLYRLFGCDPARWRDMVAVEGWTGRWMCRWGRL